MDAHRGTVPSTRLLSVVGALGAGLVALDLWLGLRYSRGPWPLVLSNVAVSVCFVAAGVVAWRLRPRSRTGVWMLVLGLVALVENPHSSRPFTDMPARALVELFGVPAYWLQWVIAGHLVLGFPSGRLRGRFERGVITAAFALAVTGALTQLLTMTPNTAICGDWCGISPIRLVANQRLYYTITTAVVVAWLGLAGVVLVLLIRRLLRSTPRERRTVGFTLVVAALSTVFFAGLQLAVLGFNAGHTARGFVRTFGLSMGWAGVIAVPIAFLIGLLRERLQFAAVGDLVRQFERAGPVAVESELRQVLRDPTLRVAFPVADKWLDMSGKPFNPPDNMARTPLGDPPVAVLVHDPALTEHQNLLDAAVASARLALDNARLYATVNAQLAEVRASRQRIAAAADAERQRLERDLHDGTQQRLLGIGLTLGVLRGKLNSTDNRDLLNELEQEVGATIRELRELAQGIRPAVLTDQGLATALAGLARRATVPVTLDLRVYHRLPPIIEVTAYYVVSEALQNIAKHACATAAQVHAAHDGDRLTIEVKDNGRGGASTLSGTGLRGLADRIDAVGGRFDLKSPPGQGTRLQAELPCPNSSSTSPTSSASTSSD